MFLFFPSHFFVPKTIFSQYYCPSINADLGLCFYFHLKHAGIRPLVFFDHLQQTSCLVLGYCFFLAQTLPFFPYPEARHRHLTRVMPHESHAHSSGSICHPPNWTQTHTMGLIGLWSVHYPPLATHEYGLLQLFYTSNPTWRSRELEQCRTRALRKVSKKAH